MTAEGSTGAPLRQQIAEAIHAASYCVCSRRDGFGCQCPDPEHLADAVVALLNLTEERRGGEGYLKTEPVRTRYVTPWLPSTPPDTSSPEPA